jgi:large subunit ribosomal protein L7/L12
MATAAADASSSAPANADPKLSAIVDDISTLTLLQAADLVSLLKVGTGVTQPVSIY